MLCKSKVSNKFGLNLETVFSYNFLFDQVIRIRHIRLRGPILRLHRERARLEMLKRRVHSHRVGLRLQPAVPPSGSQYYFLRR